MRTYLGSAQVIGGQNRHLMTAEMREMLRLLSPHVRNCQQGRSLLKRDALNHHTQPLAAEEKAILRISKKNLLSLISQARLRPHSMRTVSRYKGTAILQAN